MKSYLDIVENILVNGRPKQATRNENGVAVPVENGTIGLSQVYWEHQMSDGFPLLTCRKMPYQSIRVELEGFIKGITSKKWYQERGCKYWDWWANPRTINDRYLSEKERIRTQNLLPVDLIEHIDEKAHKKKLAEKLDDLGPIYGYQWRYFGLGDSYKYTPDFFKVPEEERYHYEHSDQLKIIVNSLKTNPYDRRMVCSAWNPNQMNQMALPPCHLLWNVCVYGDELNLHWHQRSCDTLRGIPSNIASYATLMLLLCKESGLKPGKLSAMFMDCHLYNNDLDHARAIIDLPTFDLPTLNITSKGIWDWTHKDVELINYQRGPSIQFNSITV